MKALRFIALVALTLTISACGTPKRGAATYIEPDGKTNCKVFGGWEKYTWTGDCGNGYAQGKGELRGFSGFSGFSGFREMRKYVGELKDGVLDGQGILTVPVEGTGPVTQNGTFRSGRFVSGTEKSERYGFVTIVGDGKEISHYREDSAPSVLKAIGDAAGAVAAGAQVPLSRPAQTLPPGGSGSSLSGRNSPVANNSQGISGGTSNAADPGSNASAGSRPSNRPNSAPFIESSCVSFEQTGSGISDMFKTVQSRCSVPVQVVFCFQDKNLTGNRCLNKNSGWGTTSTIHPGGKTQVSDPATSWRVHYHVCDMTQKNLLCLLPK